VEGPKEKSRLSVIELTCQKAEMEVSSEGWGTVETIEECEWLKIKKAKMHVCTDWDPRELAGGRLSRAENHAEDMGLTIQNSENSILTSGSSNLISKFGDLKVWHDQLGPGGW
jgi:hypothetical protein